MTLQEFKAWFEGFTENIKAEPTAKQWARIKERVGEVDGKVTTERVFIDRYWPSYPYGYGYPWISAPTTWPTTWISTTGVGLQQSCNNTPTFSSSTAMYSLGQMDNVTLTQ